MIELESHSSSVAEVDFDLVISQPVCDEGSVKVPINGYKKI